MNGIPPTSSTFVSPTSFLMRKSLLLLLWVLLPCALSAQHLFLQLGGGWAGHYNAHRAVGATHIALGYEFELDQHWALAPAVGFAGKGWEEADRLTPDLLYDAAGQPLRDAAGRHRQRTDAQGRPVESTMHRDYTAHYFQLDLPLHYYHRLAEHRYLRFMVGVYTAYGVGGRRRTRGDGTAAGERKIGYTDPTFSLSGSHRFDAGLKAGVAYQFPTALTVGVEANLGLLPVNRLSSDFTKEGRNMSLLLTLTYHFDRKKRISAPTDTF